MICNKCGKELKEGYPVCLNCGQKCDYQEIEKKPINRKTQMRKVILILVLIGLLISCGIAFIGFKQMSEAFIEIQRIN